MPSTIIDWLTRRASDTPHAPLFFVDEAVLTCHELCARAAALASTLVRAGLTPGARCVLRLSTSLDAIVAIYAVQRAGGVPFMVDPALPLPSATRRMSLVRPTMAITTEADPLFAEVAAPIPCLTLDELLQRSTGSALPLRSPAPADLAYLQFTSGTTGEPRAIAVSHRALVAQLDAMADRFGIGATDIVVSRASLAHSTGLVRAAFGTVRFGCRTHLLRPSVLDLGRWLPLLSTARATITHGTDFGFRYAARAHVEGRLDLSALRVATNGGDVVRAATITEFERRFGLAGVVQPAYGLSEAVLIVTSGAPGDRLRVDDHHSVSCGRPLQGVSLRVVDASRTACPPGVMGEIEVSGSSLFDGYVDHPTETRAVFHDGWLATGDLGAVDDEGRLYPRARAKAMIKRAGVTIAPREIEEAVERLPGVAAAVAFGAPVAGEASDEIVMIVEAEDSASGLWPRLVGQVHGVARGEVGVAPVRIVIVRAMAIPRTETGKIRRSLLQGLLDDEAFRDQVLFEG